MLHWVIDTSFHQVNTGWLVDGTYTPASQLATPPLNAIFKAAQQDFETRQISLADIDSIIYCSGPGSMMGLSILCAAFHSWKAMPAHLKLTFSAFHNIHLASAAHNNARVATIAGRTRLAIYEPGQNKIVDIPVDEADPAHLFLLTSPQLPSPSLNINLPTISYNLTEMSPFLTPSLLIPTDTPQPLVTRPPQFVKWKGPHS